PAALAATNKDRTPQPLQSVPKHTKPIKIARDSIIVVVTEHDSMEPLANRLRRFMLTLAQLGLNRSKFRDHSLLRRLPPDSECSIAPSPAEIMRDPQECECFRFSLSTLLAIGSREAAELNQSCLFRM